MNRTQSAIRWFTADNNPIQVFGTVGAIVVGAIAVRPIGFSGTGLAVLCLLVLVSLMTCTRLIPEGGSRRGRSSRCCASGRPGPPR